MSFSEQSKNITIAVLIDRAAHIIACDPLLTKLWGYDVDELLGKHLSILFASEADIDIKSAFVNSISNRSNTAKELVGIQKDGSLFETSVNISPLYTHKNELQNHVVQISLVVSDSITMPEKLFSVQHKPEAPTLKKEELPIAGDKGYSKTPTDCIWYWDLTTNAVTRGEGFGAIFGHQSKNDNPDIKEWENWLHPNDRQRVIDNLQVAIRGNDKNWTEEYLFEKADGTYTQVLDKGTIIRNENGIALCMIGAMHDITRERYEEEQLRIFQSIIENVNDCIVVTEAEPINGDSPKIVYVNDAFTRMTGYSKNEVIGKTPRILQGTGTDRNELDKVRKALENWESCEVEVLNYRKNGEPFWNNFSISPLANDQGWFTHWISVQREITNRKNAEEDLKQKNHELQELSAYLQTVREDERRYIAREVHEEMGQLVSALKIDVDWLQIKFSPEDDITRKRISHAIKTMDILISSIRKMASSLRPSILDDFGLNTALEWQCRESQNIYGVVCEFVSDFDDTLLPVKTATELFRIGEEALKNAMQHSKADRIKVAVSTIDHVLHLSVSDNGKGFDVSEKKSSFGLMSLRERALSLGGKLSIISQPGNGTTIDLSFPLQ